MPRTLPSDRTVSALATFDRFRLRLFAGVQDPQLRQYAFAVMAIGAGLLPLMAGSAQAALAKVPTDGADTTLMLMGSAMVLLMIPVVLLHPPGQWVPTHPQTFPVIPAVQ